MAAYSARSVAMPQPGTSLQGSTHSLGRSRATRTGPSYGLTPFRATLFNFSVLPRVCRILQAGRLAFMGGSAQHEISLVSLVERMADSHPYLQLNTLSLLAPAVPIVPGRGATCLSGPADQTMTTALAS